MKRSPREVAESWRKISRRALVLGGMQLAITGGLALRMRHLQVERADRFRLLAEENRVNIRLLPPARGLIFDRNGLQLTVNARNYKAVIVKEDAGDVEKVLARLSRLIPLAEEDLQHTLREIDRRPPFVPVTVAGRLTWESVSVIAVNAPALPGVATEVGLSREYPIGADMAHVVGYVGPVSDYDLGRIDDPDPLLQLPRFQIGKSGVEAKLERTLRGKAGTRRIEVSAAGRVMRELGRRDGEPGAELQLTVDAALQNFSVARLGSESASAVVLDAGTGDILAAASAPSFDPNKFVRGISQVDYRGLTENRYRPLVGKAVQGVYPPGSTFKMITALAALEAGVVAPEETIRCLGHVELGRRRFQCWKRGGHGNVDLNTSLQQSCDVYYYELAQRVGIDRIGEMALRLGLGRKFDLPMSAVGAGLVPTRAWKRKNRGEDWRVGDTLNAAIGQGYVLASPLQLAVMAARIATGRTVVPRLVKSVDGIEQPIPGGAPLGFDDDVLRWIRHAMYDASNSRRGTAYGSRIAEEAFRMAGKTGTSQVRNALVRNQDVPWEQRDHALFVCYAPFEAPKYTVSVVVEHGGSGAETAAPIARDIVLHALHGGYPPLEAYPAGDREEIRGMRETLPLRDLETLRHRSGRA